MIEAVDVSTAEWRIPTVGMGLGAASSGTVPLS